MKLYIFKCGHSVRNAKPRSGGKHRCPFCKNSPLLEIEITCMGCGKKFTVEPNQSKRQRCSACQNEQALFKNREYKKKNNAKLKSRRPHRSAETKLCSCCGMRPRMSGNRFLCEFCFHGLDRAEGWEFGSRIDARV